MQEQKQSAPDVSQQVDLKEKVTRESKQPPVGLRKNGRVVEYTSVRNRLTSAIAKKQTQSWLVDTYESVAETLRRVRDGEAQLGPATLARMKKIYGITRAELKRRGVSDEELDYEPASADAELQEEAAAA